MHQLSDPVPNGVVSRPRPGDRLQEMLNVILGVLRQDPSECADWLPSAGELLRGKIEHEVVANLEQSIRRLAEDLHRDLPEWRDTVARLERLSGLPSAPPAHSEAARQDEQGLIEALETSLSVAKKLDVPCSAPVLRSPDTHIRASQTTAIAIPAAPAPAEPVRCPSLHDAEALEHFRLGETFLHEGNLGAALAAFSQAIDCDPFLAAAYLERGQTHRLRGEIKDALADFTQAIHLTPESATAHLRRGNTHSDLGSFEAAITDYDRAIAIDPTQAVGYMNRGLAYAKKSEFAKVIADANEALRLDPNLAGAYFIRGAAHAYRHSEDEALADFDKLLQLEPNNVLAYNERGLLHSSRRSFDLAIADYAKALRLKPRFTLARYNRAVAFRLKGELDLAYAEFEALAQLLPKNAQVHYNRGLVSLARRNYDAAQADFSKALEIDPTLEEARSKKTEAFRAANDATGSLLEAAGLKLAEPGSRWETQQAEEPTHSHISVTCPECGGSGKIRWDRLAQLFKCRGCSKIYRINQDGLLVEVALPRPPLSKWNGFIGWGQRVLPLACLLCLLATSSWYLWKKSQPIPPTPLPEGLEPRAELLSKAWLTKDVQLMRRLTSASHERILNGWLASHEPPAASDDLPKVGGWQQAQIEVRVLQNKAHAANLLVRIEGAASPAIELRQHWVEREGAWYFLPSTGAVTARNDLFAPGANPSR